MTSSLAAIGPQLKQDRAVRGVRERLVHRALGDIEPVGSRLRGAAEDRITRRQVNVGEIERLGAIKVAVGEIAGGASEDDPDTLTVPKPLGQVGSSKAKFASTGYRRCF
jgi:hypothetical protein